MKSAVWKRAIKDCADPARARHFLELLDAALKTPREGTRPTAIAQVSADWLQNASAEQAEILAALFSGSNAQSNLLLANPEWLSSLDPDALRFPRRKQGLRNELDACVRPLREGRDNAAAFGQVRRFKEMGMLRIAARDLARIAPLPEITQEISDVADVCLESVWETCLLQLTAQYGDPHAEDEKGQWYLVTGCVIGLGKLGGQELNYSSDVDVMVVYGEEGKTIQSSQSTGQRPKPEARNPKSELRTVKFKVQSSRLKVQGSKSSPLDPRPSTLSVTNHAFFNRLVQAFVAELTRVTPEGTLYRIDLRLRPEGDLGPLSRSLEGYENYYSQWGQTWERMMLMKARCVAGDEGLASEFLEMIQPFRYPRSVNPRVLHEVAAMKDRIENEVVKAGEIERNVKLGRGGIREIEFSVQSLQLIHAGRQPFLQNSQTLPCLEKLAQYELLTAEQSRRLAEAYVFLREVEHRLQMEDNRQTHTIPSGLGARTRLAKLMRSNQTSNTNAQTPNTKHQTPEKLQTSNSKLQGNLKLQTPSSKDAVELSWFENALKAHTASVRAIFDSVLKAEGAETEQSPGDAGGSLPFPSQFAGFDAQWMSFLTGHAFRDPEKALRLLREFVEGPGYVHVSPRTSELALQLLTKMFKLCRRRSHSPAPRLPGSPVHRLPHAPRSTLHAPRSIPLSDPDRVLARLDSFIGAYGTRSALFEMWHHNPAFFELLVLLFDRSEFLAELAIRSPDLVDELVSSGRLQQRKRSDETLRDLRHGLEDADQHLWLRRYHQAELMRIGLRDILGLADFEQYLTELSALADACLEYALEAVLRRRRIANAPFAIIGLGKLGGAEIDYGSDLDVIFVAGAKARSMSSLIPLAAEVIDLLSRRTGQGIVFHTDARLRPDGEKGLLVNTFQAYEQYYLHRAQLWEIQTLTRARFVAGDQETGRQFQELAGRLTNFSDRREGSRSRMRTKTTESRPACYSPDWKQNIHKMRLRIQHERTPAGKDDLAIKTGVGGLMDAEFVAQVLCMENGWRETNTLRALELGRAEGALPDAAQFISSYRQLRRAEGILRRWSYEGETVLPDDPAPFYRVSVRCGFRTPETFRKAVTEWRRKIRSTYLKIFK
ncbi:MAG: hypothetical protein C5B50_24670 [Verrucomicrobia bacterium]|nr:MAG: hypothetical protein C5B50_24670 [Verrucomicrobiota bacterium]